MLSGLPHMRACGGLLPKGLMSEYDANRCRWRHH